MENKLVKELKNIRVMLGKSTQEFADMLGLTKDEVKLLEKNEFELTQTQLLIICSIFMNVITTLTNYQSNNKTNSKIKKERSNGNIEIIVNKLSEFVKNYNPLNHQNNDKLTGEVTEIKVDEPISLSKPKIKIRTIKED